MQLHGTSVTAGLRVRLPALVASLVLVAGLAPDAMAGGGSQRGSAASGASAAVSGTRTRYVPERRWDPAVRRAMGRFLGEEGRRVRDAEFDVHAVFRRGEVTGYTIRAATQDPGGAIRETVLDVDPRGHVTRRSGAASAELPAVRRFGGAGARIELHRLADKVRSLPGVRFAARLLNRRSAQRAALISAYATSHGLDAELADQAADPHIADVVSYSMHRDSWVFAVSDLHGGTGEGSPNEDLREGGPAMARFLRTINDGGRRRATLVCGGDCFEFMENAPIDASDAELEKLATRFIEGHAETYKALARAVVPQVAGDADRGLRVIFTRGNHDIQMVSPRVRDHLVNTMARVGGLKGAEVDAFRQRVAFAGDMAVLGQRGEWLMLHGDLHDPTNNWRENSNPFRYQFTRGGLWNTVKHLLTRGRLPALEVERVRETNMGYTIVEHFYKFIERRDPGAENSGKATAHFVGKGLLARPSNLLRLGRVMWALLGRQKPLDPATFAATRTDDYKAALAWAERTQVHRQWGLRSPEEVVARLDFVRAQMPRPVHEQMTWPLRTLNVLRMLLGGGRRIARERKNAEPLLVELLTTYLPNVIDVNAGHTHERSRVAGTVADRGQVVYRNAGTWTRVKGEDIFTVAVSRHQDGLLEEQGLFRFDAKADQLVLDSAPMPEWGSPPGWQPAAAASARPALAAAAQ